MRNCKVLSSLPPVLMLERDIERQERYYVFNYTPGDEKCSGVEYFRPLGINLKGCINRARGRLMKLRL